MATSRVAGDIVVLTGAGIGSAGVTAAALYYHFDGKQNYLPGLREASLKFSWLTDKPAYKATLGLNDQQLDIIRDYRLLRNQVHFPGDILQAPSIQEFPRPIIEFLTEFINSEIVAWSNSLITQYDMNYKPLTPL